MSGWQVFSEWLDISGVTSHAGSSSCWLHVATFRHILSHFVMVCDMLPHLVIVCHRLPHFATFRYLLRQVVIFCNIVSTCSHESSLFCTSATTPFVPTPSGSAQWPLGSALHRLRLSSSSSLERATLLGFLVFGLTAGVRAPPKGIPRARSLTCFCATVCGSFAENCRDWRRLSFPPL